MNKLLEVLLTFCLILAIRAEAEIETDREVLVLTDKNFDSAIKKHENILVEFYAPWCGHCKQLEPEYAKAAEDLAKQGSDIKLAKVDAIAEKELANKYKIQGFPTLKFFKKGDAKDFSGPREAQGIVNWLKKKTGPPAITLENEKDLEEFLKEKDVAVVGFFEDLKSADAEVYNKAADGMDEIAFAITSNKDLMKKEKAKKNIVLYKNFDEKRNDYEGKFDENEITSFIQSNSIPLVNEFSQESAPKLFGTDIKVHLIALLPKSNDKFDSHIKALKPVAKENKGKLIMVYMDPEKEDLAQILDFFGIKKEDCPTYLIYAMEKNAKFLPEDSEISEKKIGQFAKDYFAGKLKRNLKSEKLPEDWDKEPVKVLVQSNFQEVAMDKKKDVFVEFYAPWCGHCKALVPVWDKLAAEFNDRDDVVIAKLDATANELEEVEIQGFPTLKMFKKETNEIIDYSGGRDFDSLKLFVETGEMKTSEEPEEDEEDEEEGDEGDEDDEGDEGDEGHEHEEL